MLMISVRDHENNRWKRNADKKKKKRKEKKTKTEKNNGGKSYSEGIRDKWFYCAFKLGYLQLLNLILQTYHTLTYTDLLLNFESFTSFPCKISLIKCLVDRSFKICDNWNYFHNDIESIKSNLIKITYTPFLIDKVIKKISQL